ncbi:MAG: DNA-directed RNA polymerase subunit beta [Candidatus Tagabacteria bacterium CG09_land_8_20_14_0_10_41_14]|uniref:DNA-directed RNA polymerase subunit beta n=2 Tax=Candidatus Tagaibacteriota TaxID=1817918 RepID=A0A2H0WM59_9BACT|nr:MAG: DNA-directed RNA polymerase subunit beta [Candidatus Tagabacteria bacterium CG09_land_8_20_14_0_10_41_14]PJE72979.1 MAG: DNA-directed RNA polymerase subunit beta [Candidatus Tagabacteria bacterium CG10_big_fil_rev_8_21_14_0_10_40_13]
MSQETGSVARPIRPKKYFSKYREPLAEPPFLAEVQKKSFDWFLKEGLKDAFKEFFPIKDYTEKEFDMEFVDFSIDEPKFDEFYAKANNLSYGAPLKICLRLKNKVTKENKEQELYLCDLPLMTDHGTFVINGVERVIVSQLARSFGAFFTMSVFRGNKLFGAKIIPNRGAWVEIETESNNAIFARIDRKRKVAATVLLRVFGLSTNDDIKKAFAHIKPRDIDYIKETLEKDESKKSEEAYVELFRRIRPGELATSKNAKDLIDAMFDPSRYDLSVVGRYKFNQRVGFPLDNIKNESRVLTQKDLIATITEIIRLNDTPQAQPDDIDHLGNKRIRAVGEMLQERIRVGMTRMKKAIQDRMSTLEAETLTPSQLVNTRPFSAAVKEYFMTNQLSQFMSQKNVLDEVEHLRRLSAMGPGGLTRERAGFEVRDVHISHYGRICPIETPEGPNIGLVVHLATYARLNDYGIIEVPYRRVKNGRITKEIVFLDALQESKYNIAHAGVAYDKEGNLLDEQVEARVKLQPGLVARDEVDFIDVSFQQAFSVATSLIPFLEHDDANRALMGSNMQKQAVPCLNPEAPLVATGWEEKAAIDSGRLIVAKNSGVVKYVDADKIIISAEGGERARKTKTYNLVNFLRSNDFTLIDQKPVVEPGQEVKKGQVLADTSSTENGQLALGKNILVAFLSWGGANFEDAIIISERLVKDDIFTSVHIEEFSVKVRDTKLGPEITTYDIPNVGEEKLKDLDEEGVVRIGAGVRPGDILVGKISPKGEVELTPEERLLRAIFGEKAREVKDTSLRLEHGKRGRVIGVKVFSRDRGDKLETGVIKEIKVQVAQLRKISVGDKMAGRHGNKGVISKVLSLEDMPYLEDGTPVDIILNPLGVASRMNVGQILETHLGWAAERLGYQAITPPFAGVTEEEISRELVAAGLPKDGKVKLYDGRTGEPYQQKITVGQIYMLKLIHMVEDKLHMRSIGPYSLITQQPLGGKAQGGGQRFGEMEVWALEGYGAAHALQEMITIKSDDVMGRTNVFDAIVRGEKFRYPNIPAAFHVLVNELRGLALNVILEKQDGE